MSTKEYGTYKKSETNFSYLSIGSNIGDRVHNLSLARIVISNKIGKIISIDTPISEERVELLAIACIFNSLGFIYVKSFLLSQ